jgi:cell division septal protein FtsQ
MPLALESRVRPRLAERRRRVRLIMLSISVIGCLVLIAGVGLMSHHSRLTVADIRVEGTHELESRSLANSARDVIFDGTRRLFSRANIFLFPEDGIAEELRKQFPRIKEISVARESMLSQAVVVTIDERVGANTWCSADSCYLMDEHGFVFNRAVASVGYTFSGGLLPGEPIGQHVLLGRLPRVLSLLSEFARIGLAPVSVAIENESDFRVRLAAGYEVVLGFDTDIREAVRTMQLLRSSDAAPMSDTLEYLDLRFGNRVYYKKKGEGQPEAALLDESEAVTPSAE